MKHILRRTWELADDRLVVALSANTPRDADAMRGLAATALAGETGRPISLLLHPESGGAARAESVSHAMGRDSGLVCDEGVVVGPYALAGADVALALQGCGEQAIAWAMAYGLPIIADHACELLRHEQTAIVLPAAADRDLAAALCRLHDDPDTRHRLARAAAAAIGEHPRYGRLAALVPTHWPQQQRPFPA